MVALKNFHKCIAKEFRSQGGTTGLECVDQICTSFMGESHEFKRHISPMIITRIR